MKSERAKRIIEAVGFIGVVGSLIFVGIEIRQNSVATRAATNATVAQSFQEHNMMMASNPELAAAWVRSAANPGATSDEDAFLVLALWRSVFHIWSNAHRQHLNGTLDPAIYRSVAQEVAFYADRLREVGPDASAAEWGGEIDWRRNLIWAWRSNRYVFNSEFRAFVEGIIDAED